MEELPPKLKVELMTLIHQKMYMNVHFFKGKDASFVSWIATVLKPFNIEEREYIYKDGEVVNDGKYLVS